jgi:hypothetical protein
MVAKVHAQKKAVVFTVWEVIPSLAETNIPVYSVPEGL